MYLGKYYFKKVVFDLNYNQHMLNIILFAIFLILLLLTYFIYKISVSLGYLIKRRETSLPTYFDKDERIEEAQKLVMQSNKASASLLQRKMDIGYARAARILDELYEEGYVGPSKGSESREVLKKINTNK